LTIAARLVVGGVDRLVTSAAAVCLILIIGFVGVGVATRYVFNASLTATEELCQWLFIYVIFLGIPIAHRRRRHLSLTLLEGAMPAGVRRLRDVAIDAVVAWTTIQFLIHGYRLIDLIGGTSPVMELPYWMLYAIVPVTAAISLVVLTLREAAEGRMTPWPLVAILIAAGFEGAILLFDLTGFAGLSPSLIMGVGFVVTLFLGVPVAFALLFAAFFANLGADLLPPPGVIMNLMKGSSQFLLLSIPFFLTAGALMNAGGLTNRIVDLATALVGHLRGGFAQINVVSSLLYGGISGSSAADAALDSKLLVPQMVRNGYSAAFSCAITAASAILPNIIPPSVAMLLYASVASVSVGKLFTAGYLPGLFLAFLLMATVHVIALRRGYGQAQRRTTASALGRAARRSVPALAVAVFIILGIRFGIVTPTEAGVIAVLWALLIGFGAYRAYDLRSLWRYLEESAAEAALVGLMIGAAAPFAWILVGERIPQEVVGAMLRLSRDPVVLLTLVNLIMLVAGMFIDVIAALLVLVPLFLPLIKQMQVDPIHFGIICVVNLMYGALTPPVGYLAFVTSSVSGTPIQDVFRALTPFIAVLILGLVVITFVPALSLALL